MENTDVKSNVDGLELYSDNYPFRLPLKIKNFGFNAYFTYFEKFNKNHDINFGLNFKLFDIKSR